MDWEKFELITRDLAAAVVNQVDNVALAPGCGRNNKLTGVSTVRHQIDVSLVGPQDVLLVECKCLQTDSVGLDILLAFRARLVDICPLYPEHCVHGIVVTTIGFTKPAAQFATHYGIGMNIIQSAEEFGLCYKNFFSQGVVDRGQLSATETATVARFPAPV